MPNRVNVNIKLIDYTRRQIWAHIKLQALYYTCPKCNNLSSHMDVKRVESGKMTKYLFHFKILHIVVTVNLNSGTYYSILNTDRGN